VLRPIYQCAHGCSPFSPPSHQTGISPDPAYRGIMTGRDDGERLRPYRPPGSSGSPAGDDVLETGRRRRPAPRWRPPTAALVLGAAGLLVGLAVGYAAGVRHTGKPVSPSRTAASPARPVFAAGGFPLSQSGPECSAQIGHELQLGVEVTNLSATAVTLRRVRVVLPLGGLRETAQAWGSCGDLPTAGEAPGLALPPTLRPGASAWFTVTFQVLVRCPEPLPVQFTVDFDQNGQPAGAMPLPSFPDLGQVRYGNCR
jgi:hypothetical protein